MIKLKANNVEDLKVIASLVQDAILPIGDFAYFKADQKYLWSSITEYEGIRNASYRYDWKSSTSYFKKNKLYFEQAWSSK